MPTNEMVISTAKDVHEYLKMYCEENGAPETTTKHGPGWTLETRPLGAWVKDLGMSKELEKTYVVDLVRNYLTASGNVVIMKRTSYRPMQFRLFVRKTWNPSQMVRADVGNLWRVKQEQKISAKDAGEDREPAPVTTRELWTEFSNHPLSEQQIEILIKLLDNRGKYRFGQRESVEKGLKLDTKVTGSAAGAVRSLEERGLLQIKRRHVRQIDWLALTPTGRWAAQNAEYLGTTDRAIMAYLRTHRGKFVGSSVSKTSRELAEQIHKHPHTIMDSLHKLENEGKVRLHHPTNSHYVGSVELIGYEEEPAVTDLSDEELEQMEPQEEPEQPQEEPEELEVHNGTIQPSFVTYDAEKAAESPQSEPIEMQWAKSKAYSLISEAVTLLTAAAPAKTKDDPFRDKVKEIVTSGANPYSMIGQIVDLIEQEDD